VLNHIKKEMKMSKFSRMTENDKTVPVESNKTTSGIVSDQTSESDPTKEIKMTGPLSEIYTKALQIVYAKTEPQSGIMAVESAANDTLMLIAARKANVINNTDNLSNTYRPPSNANIYTAYADDFNLGKVIDVTKTLNDYKTIHPQIRNILVLDGGDASTGNYIKPIDSTTQSIKVMTESICKATGIELYYSFESLVKHL
jgi:hypothetical protein